MNPRFQDRFTLEEVEHGQTNRSVFVSKNEGKPIIILHELLGMNPAFVDYCLRMSEPENGFKVCAPLMFKDVGTDMNIMQMGWFCVQREFRNLYWRNRTGEESEFSKWLLHLAGIVSTRHKGSKVGVIGMCLTGGFALVTLAEPGVNAVVCCQPAFPFRMRIGALGMSKKELAACAAGAQTLGKDCVVGFRYEADKLSRPVHIEAIQRLLNAPELNAPENESNEPVRHFRYHDLQGSGHSTVTGNPPDDTVVQEILAFLEERL